jgi:hypothetical protein
MLLGGKNESRLFRIFKDKLFVKRLDGVDIDNGGALVFQKTAGGTFMSKYKFYDGDRIFVNVYYREKGYALAYKSGAYGYVDARYIDW